MHDKMQEKSNRQMEEDNRIRKEKIDKYIKGEQVDENDVVI